MTQDEIFARGREKYVALFLKHVVPVPEGCWQWTGDKDYQGYATVCGLKAARISWILHTGHFPGKRCVLHSCDNPECTNFKCLWLGNKGKNNTDRALKGRNKFNWPTLTIHQVKSIRRKYERMWKIARLA